MESIVGYGIILSLAFTFLALSVLVIRTLSFEKKSDFAVPLGDWKKGVAYAFGKGLMPWEKESARKHILTYIAGFLYHFGIFSALIVLVLMVFSIPIPPPAMLLARILIGLGLFCGVGLFIKRILVSYMRRISCPDDYAANLIVDVFLLLSFLTIFIPDFRMVFYLSAIVMILYIPLGKIRHCFFFFYSRLLFGRFYGRRGVLDKKRFQMKV
jgi:hypothetical protein